MSFLCRSYELVCHSYIIRMPLVCARFRMSLLYSRMSFVCHLYVLVCHPYVTRMYSYVLSSVCQSSVVLPWTLWKIAYVVWYKKFSNKFLLQLEISATVRNNFLSHFEINVFLFYLLYFQISFCHNLKHPTQFKAIFCHTLKQTYFYSTLYIFKEVFVTIWNICHS